MSSLNGYKVVNYKKLGYRIAPTEIPWPSDEGKLLWQPGDPVPTLPFGQHERIQEALDEIYIPAGCGLHWNPLIRFLASCGLFFTWPKGHRKGERITFDDWQFHQFIPKYCLYYDPLIIENWDKDALTDIMEGELGRLILENAKRYPTKVIRRVSIMVGRGSGKTTSYAVEALNALIDPARPRSDWGLYASSKDQAGLTFKPISLMIEDMEDAGRFPEGVLKVSDSTWKAVNTLDRSIVEVGVSVSARAVGTHHDEACIDELFAQIGPDLFDAQRTGMGKVPNTCLTTMTTPHPSTPGEAFARTEMQQAEKIKRDPSRDPNHLVRIYTADKTRPWDDLDNIMLANPHIKHGVLDPLTLQIEIDDAKRDPRNLEAYKGFRMVWWNDDVEGSLFVLDDWDERVKKFPKKLGYKIKDGVKKKPNWRCVIGADIGLTSDLTSVCVAWWSPHSRKVYVSFKTWATKRGYDRLHRWSSGAVDKWIEESRTNLVVTHRKRVNIEEVHEYLLALCDNFFVTTIGLDWDNAHHSMDVIEEEYPKVEVLQLAQGRGLSGAIKKLETMVLEDEIGHNGDPIVRHCLENLKINNTRSEYLSVDRSDRRKGALIDCGLSLIMAIDRVRADMKQYKASSKNRRKMVLVDGGVKEEVA